MPKRVAVSRSIVARRATARTRAAQGAGAHPADGVSHATGPEAAPERASRKPISKRKLANKLLSGGALLFAGALLVGTTVPANAFRVETYTPAASEAVALAGQNLQVEGQATAGERDSFSATSASELRRQTYGTRSYAYQVSTAGGAIRWPFPFTSPISSGFGERSAPCYGCSSNHQGVDFTPGYGTPIQAIADGVVVANEYSAGYGYMLEIEHQINGQTVTSIYAHMIAGSATVQVGQQIAVGGYVGQVGNSGASTGAHLHLEIHVNGSPVDPYAWLSANAS